jgi:predicted enzyme related to lactoylglutathione lyase
MANSVVHFEIFASDVERARKFYERVFGWKFEVAGPPDFYLIVTGPDTDPGITQGLIAKRSGPAAQGPLNSFRCTISVSSIVDSLSAIEAAGASCARLSSTFRTSARSPKLPIPRTTSSASCSSSQAISCR